MRKIPNIWRKFIVLCTFLAIIFGGGILFLVKLNTVSGENITDSKSGSVNIKPENVSTRTKDLSAEVPGLAISIRLDKPENVFLYTNVTGGNGGAVSTGDKTIFQMAVDSKLVGPAPRVSGHFFFTKTPFSFATALFDYDEAAAMNTVVHLESGLHVITVRYATTNDGGYTDAYTGGYPSSIGFIILGE